MNLRTSMKRVQIDKSRNTAMIIVAVTTIVTIFSLFSAKALLSQAAYQRKVINEKHKAVDQLKENVEAAKTLASQYEVFRAGNPNIIGGKGGGNSGTGLSDGDNPKIVLDSLPSLYDFPALISSVEKIISLNRIKATGIGGTDLGQDTSSSEQPAGKPQPVIIPFTINAATSYDNARNLIRDLERSIRPMDVTSMELSGRAAEMQIALQVNTYYQPGTSLIITEEEVK